MAEATCERCGDKFHGREGARYCGSRCRQASYRSRRKVRAEHSPAGWPESCAQLTEDSGGGARMCDQTATWQLWEQPNRGSHVGAWLVSYWCDAHLADRAGQWEVADVSAGHVSVRGHG